ncbi:hypothetical protein HRbin38_00415 [bacterium HR38]|nr:hypothetical protein HRbin38_00415 [bacterium HR38]
MLHEDLAGLGVGFVQDLADVLVDEAGGFLGVVLLLGDLLTQEDGAGVRTPGDVLEVLPHTPVQDHAFGDLGGPFEVVLGPGGHGAGEELLRHPARHEDGQFVHEVVLGNQNPFLGFAPAGTQGHAPGDDGNLLGFVGVGQNLAHHGMPGLMVGHGPLLLLGKLKGRPLEAQDDLVQGLQEVLLADFLGAIPGRQQGCLVDQVLQVGPGEARGEVGQLQGVHLLGDGFTPHVHQEDIPALLQGG